MGATGKAVSNSKGDILQFKRPDTDEVDISELQFEKWHYPSITKHINKIEAALEEANTRNKIQSVYRAIMDTDRTITSQLSTVKEDLGDENVLLTQRRRVRQLKKKLIAKGENL